MEQVCSIGLIGIGLGTVEPQLASFHILVGGGGNTPPSASNRLQPVI